MTVWLLTWEEFEDFEIEGVYSTQEKAEAALRAQEAELVQQVATYTGPEWNDETRGASVKREIANRKITAWEVDR